MPSRAITAGVLAGALIVGGCAGRSSPAERRAREEVAAIAALYRPGAARPLLPALSTDSPLSDYLRFGMLNSPRVEGAYYAWVGRVERITAARSLPDPRLTFEADITDMVEALMPGLMVDLPGPGKLRAAADAAAGEAEAGYAAFEAELLSAALAIKSAYYRLHFLEEKLRVQRQTLALLGDLEQLAQSQHAAGRVTLQDVLRAQIDREQIATEIADLEDSRSVLLAELKAALGLGAGEPDPPIPATFDPSPNPPAPEEILASALDRNPNIRTMAADVRRAQGMLELARRGSWPDASLGIEADVEAAPVMWRPSAGITLPIWRDRIRAEIAAAQAEKRGAEARLTAEQVSLAAELASALYLYRQSVRNQDLLAGRLIPRARQSLDVARAGYTTSRSSFLDVIDAQRQLLAFELSLIEARMQRELALATLSLAIQGIPPPGAPVRRPPTTRTAAPPAASEVPP